MGHVQRLECARTSPWVNRSSSWAVVTRIVPELLLHEASVPKKILQGYLTQCDRTHQSEARGPAVALLRKLLDTHHAIMRQVGSRQRAYLTAMDQKLLSLPRWWAFKILEAEPPEPSGTTDERQDPTWYSRHRYKVQWVYDSDVHTRFLGRREAATWTAVSETMDWGRTKQSSNK